MTHPWQFQTKDGRALRVRPVRAEDAPALYETARHPQVARTLMLHPAMELAETVSFIEGPAPGRHYLVAELDGRAVGAVTLQQFQRPRLQHLAGLGILVSPDYWNLGIGGFLMQAALDIADNWLNLTRVELGVHSNNPHAVHLYERCGFESEGLRRLWIFGDGRWLDNLLMARLRPTSDAGPEASPAAEPATVQRPSAPAPRGQVTIRPPAPGDDKDLNALMSHPLVGRTTLQLPSLEIAATRQQLAAHRPGNFRFVAEVHGRVVGSINLHLEQNPRRRHAAGLGMFVHPAYWNQGIGSKLMEAVVDLADNWLNISRLELDVNVDNPAGVRLYQKFGFEIEGTRRFHAYGDGRWAHSYFMARLKE